MKWMVKILKFSNDEIVDHSELVIRQLVQYYHHPLLQAELVVMLSVCDVIAKLDQELEFHYRELNALRSIYLRDKLQKGKNMGN